MDVTDRETILEAKKAIEESDGKLHILVNWCVVCFFRRRCSH
jgi:hypothetical protein